MVILYYILLIISLIYGLYFAATGLWAFVRKQKQTAPSETEYKNRFAVIIAARNEAGVIGNLIDSIKAQNYDKDRVTVYTAVNNCTDNTEFVAKMHGSEIISCPNTVRSKGDVLKRVFAEYGTHEDIDAFVIFDADNIVHPDYLKHINHAINEGALVMQCKRDTKNLSDNWISAGYSLFYYIQNFFFNRARDRVGLSGSINGTGFAVTRKALSITGFDTHTMTEDIEYTAICALHNVRIKYVEEAVTYDEQPTGFGDSVRQRKRWSKGNLQCFLRYLGRLFAAFFKTGNISCLDMGFNFAAPAMTIVTVVSTAMLMAFSLFGVRLNDILSYVFAYGWLFMALTYLSGIVVASLILKINGHRAEECTSGVLLFTLFLLTWLPINISVLFSRNTNWVPIKHTKNVSIENLLEKN